MNRKRDDGFSLIELLIAGALLVTLLGLLANFLVQQSELNQRTQARNEAQDKARVAMQLVVQDLQLSGAEFYVDAAGDVREELADCTEIRTWNGGSWSPGIPTRSCFGADDDGDADDFGTVYITTTRSDLSEACRQVFWALEGGDLLRVDRTTECNNPGTADPESSEANTAFTAVDTNVMATNVVAFNVLYRCSNGAWINNYPNSACPATSSYLRSAIVSLYAASDDRFEGGTNDSFDYFNASADNSTRERTTVDCPDDRTCLGLTQEVLLPNLRTQ